MSEVALEAPRCEVCGDPIRRNTKWGICSDPTKPACIRARNQKAWAARPGKPEQRFCEFCGDPIRSDNTMGICFNPAKIACARERRRREALRDGRTPPLEIFPGDTFGYWTVLEYYYARNGGGVLVRCDYCKKGTVRRVPVSRLINGRSRSCGCAPYRPRAPKEEPYLAAGAVFGPFKVLEDVATWKDQVRILCGECGNEETLAAMRVKLGLAKSCGCLTKTHGFSKHPLYSTWASMVQRCHNPNHASYRNYGGRTVPGPITVCDRWRFDPWLFAEDIYREIGPRPEERDEKGRVLYEFDRIDNDRGYEPGNVRWADKKTQKANQRTVADMTDRCGSLVSAIAERDARIELLTARLQAPIEQRPASRKRKAAPPREEPLF